jgi:hypothetical protein
MFKAAVGATMTSPSPVSSSSSSSYTVAAEVFNSTFKSYSAGQTLEIGYKLRPNREEISHLPRY